MGKTNIVMAQLFLKNATNNTYLQGFSVIACCLAAETSEGAQTLRTEGSERLHVIQMNVCNTEEVTAARAKVDEILSEGGELFEGIRA